MTLHPRGLIVTAAFGFLLWLAVDVRLLAAAVIATAVCDWLQLTSLVGAHPRSRT
jgi:hypothetical protein